MSQHRPVGLRGRVWEAAEAVLKREGAVGPLELLQQIGFLHFSHFQQWQKGNEYYSDLESHIQCGEKKLNETYCHFFEWVRENRLEPIEASYAAASRFGSEPVQVTVDGDPERERFFRTQFRPSDLSPAKQQRLEKKLNKTPDLIVYQLTSRQSACSECGAEIFKDELLFLERQQPLCLVCADLDQLEFLPRGDTALTRRTRKYSPLIAVVVRFSRARKRYERQGILATPDAIGRAEAECAGDADQRAARRELAAARCRKQDQQLVGDLTAAILQQFPGCPAQEAAAIAEHTALRGSGRIGRTARGQTLSPDAISLAVAAWVRHQHTDYDRLLMRGIERLDARASIADDVRQVLAKWNG
jgi:hypothetical protein